MPVEAFTKCSSCFFPNVVGTHRLIWVAGRQIEFKIFESETTQHRHHKIEQGGNFVGHLFFGAKDVTVVLREATNTQQTVQSSGTFVAIHGAEFKKSQWQLAVAALPAAVNKTVHRAVHWLRVIRTVVHFHGRIHAIFVKIEVT